MSETLPLLAGMLSTRRAEVKEEKKMHTTHFTWRRSWKEIILRKR